MVLSAFRTSVILSLANMGASFIDGLVTSHYMGFSEMAAIGLASPFFTISSALCTCVGTGMLALCAHNIGSGKNDKLNKYFNNALWVVLILSVLLMFVFLLGARPIARILGARDDHVLLENTSTYFYGLALGLPAFLLSGTASQVIQMDNGRNLVLISAVSCLLTDAFLDILSVLCGWGLFGIGLATSISMLVKFCVLFSRFFRTKLGTLRLKIQLPDFSYIFRMIRSGSDTLTLSVINIVKPILLNALVLSVGGSAALSVMSVYNNLNSFATVFCTGLSSSLSIMIGIFYGEVNKRDIKYTVGFIQKLVLIMYVPIILLLIFFSDQIAHCYLADAPEMWDMMKFALYCLSFSLITFSIISLRIRYLQTVNQIIKSHILTFFANFAVVLICSYVASFIFGVYGIIAANAISSVICILGIVILTQLLNKKFFVTSEDYLCLPSKFYPKNEAFTFISIKCTDSIGVVISYLRNFYCKYEIRSDVLLLYAEKLLTLRMTEVKKAKYNIDIRAEILDDTYRLTIRDDGPKIRLSEESLTDELVGISDVSYKVNLHRVLDCNSMILQIMM